MRKVTMENKSLISSGHRSFFYFVVDFLGKWLAIVCVELLASTSWIQGKATRDFSSMEVREEFVRTKSFEINNI